MKHLKVTVLVGPWACQKVASIPFRAGGQCHGESSIQVHGVSRSAMGSRPAGHGGGVPPAVPGPACIMHFLTSERIFYAHVAGPVAPSISYESSVPP